MVKPKQHYALHLPLMLLIHGCLLSTLVNERRHRVIKRYTRDRCTLGSSWELGALEEVVAFQCHEAKHVEFYNVSMLEPHPPGSQLLQLLMDVFPHSHAFKVANRLRTDWGTLTCGDYCFYVSGEHYKVGLLDLVFCSPDLARVMCWVTPLDFVRTIDTRWSLFVLGGAGTITVPSTDMICSATIRASMGEYAVFVPLFLR